MPPTGKHLSGLFVCLLIAPLFSAPVQETRKVEGLIYDLKHPDAKRKKEAAVQLGKNRVRQAVPALIELTQDPDHMIRLEAVRALVRINDTRALQAYIRLTRDINTEIQKKSIEGILAVYVVEGSGFVHGVKKIVGFVNPLHDDYDPLVVESYIPVSQDAIDVLAALLNSSEMGIRKEAARALGVLRAHSALPAIQDLLVIETDNGVKVELVRAIYKIADRQAALALVPLIDDPDRKVRDEAIFAVGRLKVSEAVQLLMDLYQSGVQERRTILGIVPVSGSDILQKMLFEALAFIGDPGSKELFLDVLDHEEKFFRRYAGEGIGRIGDQSYTTLLAKQYLREEEGDVRLAFSFALYRLGRDEHLLELVESSTDGDQGFHYLLELEPEEVPKLYSYLRSEKDSIKARLLEVVGLRGGESALPIVQEMIGSQNADVVSAANLALRRIQGRGGGTEKKSQDPGEVQEKGTFIVPALTRERRSAA